MIGKTEFMIGGWLAPAQNAEEDYRLAKACGVNTMYLIGEACGWVGDKEQTRAVEICSACGMAAIPMVENNLERVCCKDFLQYDNIPAVILYDEPSAELFPKLSKTIREFRKFYPDRIRSEINLLPSYSTEAVLGTKDYPEYVERFVGELLPEMSDNKVLSIDYYPLYSSEDGYVLDPGWLKCLSVLTYHAKRSNTPTHCFIQTMPFAKANDVAQNFETLRFQFMTYLAMGFRAFTHFCYASPGISETFLEHQEAIVGRDGKPTGLYEPVRQVNALIQTFAEAYLRYAYEGTCGIAADGGPTPDDFANWMWQLEKNDLPVNEIHTTCNLLVGKFRDDEGRQALFLTNYTFGDSQMARIDLDFGQRMSLSVHQNGKTQEAFTADGHFSMDLESGNGSFIEIKGE